MRNISYSNNAFGDHAQLIRRAKAELKGVDFDTMVGMGLSGALVIPTLAQAMGKKWAIIRKDGDGSHAYGARFEGEIGDRWVFVDDFISSGRTLEAVKNGVRRAARDFIADPRKWPLYTGAYLYGSEDGPAWQPAGGRNYSRSGEPIFNRFA